MTLQSIFSSAGMNEAKLVIVVTAMDDSAHCV